MLFAFALFYIVSATKPTALYFGDICEFLTRRAEMIKRVGSRVNQGVSRSDPEGSELWVYEKNVLKIGMEYWARVIYSLVPDESHARDLYQRARAQVDTLTESLENTTQTVNCEKWPENDFNPAPEILKRGFDSEGEVSGFLSSLPSDLEEMRHSSKVAVLPESPTAKLLAPVNSHNDIMYTSELCNLLMARKETFKSMNVQRVITEKSGGPLFVNIENRQLVSEIEEWLKKLQSYGKPAYDYLLPHIEALLQDFLLDRPVHCNAWPKKIPPQFPFLRGGESVPEVVVLSADVKKKRSALDFFFYLGELIEKGLDRLDAQVNQWQLGQKTLH